MSLTDGQKRALEHADYVASYMPDQSWQRMELAQYIADCVVIRHALERTGIFKTVHEGIVGQGGLLDQFQEQHPRSDMQSTEVWDAPASMDKR